MTTQTVRPWTCCWFYCTTSSFSHLPSPLCISPTRFKSFEVISQIYSGPDPTAPNQTIPFQIHPDRRSRLLHSSLPASNDDVACVHSYRKEPNATQGPCSLTPEIGGGKSGGSHSWGISRCSVCELFYCILCPMSQSPAQPASSGLHLCQHSTLQFAPPRAADDPVTPLFCRSRRVLSACQALTAVFASTDQSAVGLFLLTMAWHHHRRKSLHV